MHYWYAGLMGNKQWQTHADDKGTDEGSRKTELVLTGHQATSYNSGRIACKGKLQYGQREAKKKVHKVHRQSQIKKTQLQDTTSELMCGAVP